VNNTADMELARGVAAAERDAFDALFERYVDRVYALARRCATGPESACDLTGRMLEQVFSDIALYRGDVSLDSWVLGRCKRVGADAPAPLRRSETSQAPAERS
jgi:DNA-directed RNA polymerase specialized sigma24 family protein